MFGVIVSIILKVNKNVHLFQQLLNLNVDDLPDIYDEILKNKNKNIELKIGRLDVNNPKSVKYLYF